LITVLLSGDERTEPAENKPVQYKYRNDLFHVEFYLLILMFII
jgi:hypothetical protein